MQKMTIEQRVDVYFRGWTSRVPDFAEVLAAAQPQNDRELASVISQDAENLITQEGVAPKLSRYYPNLRLYGAGELSSQAAMQAQVEGMDRIEGVDESDAITSVKTELARLREEESKQRALKQYDTVAGTSPSLPSAFSFRRRAAFLKMRWALPALLVLVGVNGGLVGWGTAWNQYRQSEKLIEANRLVDDLMKGYVQPEDWHLDEMTDQQKAVVISDFAVSVHGDRAPGYDKIIEFFTPKTTGSTPDEQ